MTARPQTVSGTLRKSRVAAVLLSAVPLFAPMALAQDPSAVPLAVPPTVPGIEAPALPDTAAPWQQETAPTLPTAEQGAPGLAEPAGPQPTVPQPTVPQPTVPQPTAPQATTAQDTAAPAPGDLDAATGGDDQGPRRHGDHGRPDGPGDGRGTHSGPPLPHELSPWGMFMAADMVVKGVMIGLAFATFVTLTVLLYKLVELALARTALRRSARVIRDAVSLPAAAERLKGRKDPAAFMAQAALDEYDRSVPALEAAGVDGVKERTRSLLERTEAQAGRRLMRGTGILATIGSTAPFVGLFGTVWGILNSFIGISKSQTTNLAVVAPGIAEALLATAIGLVAAIPAVVVYNHFARQISGYKLALGDAGAGIERLLSRDLDFRRI